MLSRLYEIFGIQCSGTIKRRNISLTVAAEMLPKLVIFPALIVLVPSSAYDDLPTFATEIPSRRAMT
jgi:hypothetical protein